jgi:hypothetical protein
MKKLNQIFLLLIASLTMSLGCKKDKQSPADPFASLSNQLVCKVNGSEWKSNYVRVSFYNSISPQIGKYIFLYFENGTQVVDFIINSPYKTGTVLFNQNTASYPNTLSPKDYAVFLKGYSNLTPEEEYITNSNDTGSINFIVMDSVQKRVKATFSFTGKDNRTGKKVSVTEGYLEYHQ